MRLCGAIVLPLRATSTHIDKVAGSQQVSGNWYIFRIHGPQILWVDMQKCVSCLRRGAFFPKNVETKRVVAVRWGQKGMQWVYIGHRCGHVGQMCSPPEPQALFRSCDTDRETTSSRRVAGEWHFRIHGPQGWILSRKNYLSSMMR